MERILYRYQEPKKILKCFKKNITELNLTHSLITNPKEYCLKPTLRLYIFFFKDQQNIKIRFNKKNKEQELEAIETNAVNLKQRQTKKQFIAYSVNTEAN
jgi:hypothetical protein